MLNWYNLPTYYDVSFSHDMQDELVFLKAVFSKYCSLKNCNILEPACGTGRLIIPLSRAGFNCSGFDLNENALQYLKSKLERNKLGATIFQADMSAFPIKKEAFDAAYCTVDTFRHLLTEKSAKQHLTRVASSLKENGLYILGLHLLPKQGITDKVSRWTAKRGGLTVKTSMTLIGQDIRKRTETLRVILNAETITQKNKYESVYKLRTYTSKQFKRLISSTKLFEIESIFDHYYDLDRPVILNEKSDYGVFILRKIT